MFHIYALLQAETKFYNGLLFYGEGGNLPVYCIILSMLVLLFKELIKYRLVCVFVS